METQDVSRQKLFARRDFPVRVRCWKGTRLEDLTLYRHDEIELQFICQGEGEYFIRSRQYKFRKNSVLAIHGNEPHTFVKEGGLLTEKISVLFSPKILKDRQAAHKAITDLKGISHIVLSDRLATRSRLILEQMIEECRSKETHWEDLVIDLLETFLVVLARRAAQAVFVPDEDDPLTRAVAEYVEQHFAEDLSLIGVAGQFNMSPYSLSRIGVKSVEAKDPRLTEK